VWTGDSDFASYQITLDLYYSGHNDRDRQYECDPEVIVLSCMTAETEQHSMPNA